MSHRYGSAIPDDDLIEFERFALDLARTAGSQVEAAIGSSVGLNYKYFDVANGCKTDPVTNIDLQLEETIRSKIAVRYADHAVVGEEMENCSLESETIWAIDPLDGTDNFVSGFPMFAVSIGLLHMKLPVVGAVWCSTSHALRPGVYHARRGGQVLFEGRPIDYCRPTDSSRWLGSSPDLRRSQKWGKRITGAAAVECAYVASGLLQFAHFTHPKLWDIAAGIVLVTAGGLVVACKTNDGWEALTQLSVVPPTFTQNEIILGEARAVTALCHPLEK